MDLTVDVGLRHVVQVNEGELAHARTRKGLCRPRSDATNAHHHDMGVEDGLSTCHAIEPSDPAEAAFEVDVTHSRSSNQSWKRIPSAAPATIPATAMTLVRLIVDRPERP